MIREIRTKKYEYNLELSDIQDLSQHQPDAKDMFIISSTNINTF